MANTTKRYLLPSEIEGVLRSGGAVYTLNGNMTSRYTWTVDGGIQREWCTEKISDHWQSEEKPNNAAPRKFIRSDLSSWDVYTIVSVCECGRIRDLNDKCSCCDDMFF